MARPSRAPRRIAGTLLFLALAVSLGQFFFHYRNIQGTQITTVSESGTLVKVSDFPWSIDRPKEPVMYGWEDKWMAAWKRNNYKQDQEGSCRLVHEKSPTFDGTLCEMPAYVPPRALPSTQQKISRVIFQSHLYRRVSMSQYVQFASWVALNPTYEYILFDDDDIDDFMCENVGPNVSQPFSQLVAGAAKADFWRALVMSKYGGVYVDADLTALTALPIQPNDNLVSGVGCWSTLPEAPLGVLEHWSMAFSPHHPLPTETVRFILENLNDPAWVGDVESTTGPSPYQKALLYLLEKAKCTSELCKLARETDFWKHHCEPEAFSRIFGTVALLPELNFNYTYANKLIETSEYLQGTFSQVHYQFEPHKPKQIPHFCAADKRSKRRKERVERWNSALRRKQEKLDAKKNESD